MVTSMDNAELIARALVRCARRDGGCTMDKSRTRITSGGHAVGGVLPTLVLHRADGAAVREFVRRSLISGSDVFGSWRDEGGAIHIDAVDIIEDRDVALEIARERNEIAIYDLDNREEVRV